MRTFISPEVAVKKLRWHDILFIKLSSITFILLLLTSFSSLETFFLGFEWYYYLALTILFILPPLKSISKKEASMYAERVKELIKREDEQIKVSTPSALEEKKPEPPAKVEEPKQEIPPVTSATSIEKSPEEKTKEELDKLIDSIPLEEPIISEPIKIEPKPLPSLVPEPIASINMEAKL